MKYHHFILKIHLPDVEGHQSTWVLFTYVLSIMTIGYNNILLTTFIVDNAKGALQQLEIITRDYALHLLVLNGKNLRLAITI